MTPDRDDPLLDACLDEVLGGRRPPDLTARIMQALAERASANGNAHLTPVPPPVLTVAPPVASPGVNGRPVVELSPRGLQLFHALLVEQLSIEEIAERFAMSANALYTFRSRLRQQVLEIRRELTCTPQPGPVAAVHRLPQRPAPPGSRRSLGGEP